VEIRKQHPLKQGLKQDRVEIRPMDYLEEKLGKPAALEKSLAKHWDDPEEDKAWEYLKDLPVIE
jgi:hypothetical protein